MENKIPTIEIDMDKKCKQCGKGGAGPAGLCLTCVGKILDARWKEYKRCQPVKAKAGSFRRK